MTVLLKNLDVLAIDCQATGGNPDKEHLLEIGWLRIRASVHINLLQKDSLSYLIRLPKEVKIPKPVQRITGISANEMEPSIFEEKAWELLSQTARGIAAADRRSFCTAVIHYARYEEPFLRKLHRQFHPETLFPLEIICTHEIVKRLLPELPRKGLRAIAGHFGHTVPEKRRCTHHIIASAIIWRYAIQLLDESQGIITREALFDWLNSPPPERNSHRIYPMSRNIRLALPDAPGVYRMRRSNGDLLYVGKARSLRQRVNSYFQKQRRHAEHLLEMLTQASDLDVTLTGSALEAAILESDDIKRFEPPYNVALRKKDRTIGFRSKDFRHHSPNPNSLHSVGPLPSEEALLSLAAIRELLEIRLKDSLDINGISAALDIPSKYAPDIPLFREGFETFYTRHDGILQKEPTRHGLIRLGVRLWRRRLQEKLIEEASADDTESDRDDPDPDTDWVWTPETVADTIENAICRGVHLMRRARWFCLLSESSLAWETRNGDPGQKHLVVLKQGKVVHRGILSIGDTVPIPPGYERKFRERQQCFNVQTYDRVRIVTTEIRRLVSEGRAIELCLRPKIILQREALEKLFRWV